jgi:hypothetical protein
MNEKLVERNFQLIDLNDLPKYSHWPARLLGLEEWELQEGRTGKRVLREYGEKWGGVLNDYEKQKFGDFDDAIKYLFSMYFPPHLLIHMNEQIYYSETNEFFWDFFYSKIINILKRYLTPTDTLVELGCGWGRNLFYALKLKVCKKAVGGEYTQEGIKLGELISKQYNLPIEFYHFDYRNQKPEFMEKLKDTIVFTHNSIEQINYIPKESVRSLIESGPKAVIHFEPIYEYRNKDSLLHYLWKRYTEVNDYNRNLLTVLKTFEREGKIRITIEEIHSLGLNAFNPGSFIAWEII